MFKYTYSLYTNIKKVYQSRIKIELWKLTLNFLIFKGWSLLGFFFNKNIAFFDTVEFLCEAVFFFVSKEEKYEETLSIVADSLVQILFHVTQN